jgi:hypothetical protein
MEIERNPQVEKEAIKIEKLNGLSFVYLETNNSKIYIERSALFKMLEDMERNYETAGMLLGNSREDGNGEVIVLEKYRPNKCDKGRTYTLITTKALKNELEKELKKDAFDSVIFVHLHPPLRNYMANSNYIVFGEELNESDRNAAYSFHELATTQLGLKHVFSGVVTLRATHNGDPIFKFEIYDTSNKCENVYFKLEGEIDKKDVFYSLLRKPIIQFQTVEYLFKDALRRETKYIKSPLPQNLGPEQLRNITESVNKELNALPPKVRKNFSYGIKEEPINNSKYFTMKIEKPPRIFYRLYKMYEKAENKIMGVVEELIYGNIK